MRLAFGVIVLLLNLFKVPKQAVLLRPCIRQLLLIALALLGHLHQLTLEGKVLLHNAILCQGGLLLEGHEQLFVLLHLLFLFEHDPLHLIELPALLDQLLLLLLVLRLAHSELAPQLLHLCLHLLLPLSDLHHFLHDLFRVTLVHVEQLLFLTAFLI